MKNLRICFTLILTLVFAFPTFGVNGNALPAYTQSTGSCDPHHSCYTCYGCGCYYFWDDSCWDASSGVTPVSDIPCANPNGWGFGMGWSQTLTKTFTADSSYPSWELDFQVFFDDPNHDWFDQLNATVYVTHANGGTSIYQLWSHVGNDPVGSLYCVRPYGTFYAVSGDVITIEFKTTNFYENTRIRVNNIIVWGNPF